MWKNRLGSYLGAGICPTKVDFDLNLSKSNIQGRHCRFLAGKKVIVAAISPDQVLAASRGVPKYNQCLISLI